MKNCGERSLRKQAHINDEKIEKRENKEKKPHRILFSKFVIYTMFVIYCVSYNYLWKKCMLY